VFHGVYECGRVHPDTRIQLRDGFLGVFAAFFICVIGPIGAKVALEGRCSWFDGLVLIIALAMAFWGTVSLQFV